MRKGMKDYSEETEEGEYVLPSESDETGGDSQSSGWTFGSVGTGNWTQATIGTARSTDSAYLETILRGDDMDYVKQKFGKMSILFSVLQLFVLTMAIALCGIAPITINPAIGPYPDALSLVGATNSYAIFKQFQVWRFLVSPLITAGILHFLCIVGIQLEIGAFFERDWGSKAWLQIYLSSAFGSVLWDCTINHDGVSVGGTGPLVGLFGAKISEIIMLMSFKTRDSYLVDGMHQLLAILFTLFFVSLLICFPYVEWGGHFGGFLTGFIIGMFVFSKKIKHRSDRKIWSGSGILLTFFILVVFVRQMLDMKPSADLADVCEYYENMHPENYDCQCAL